MKKNLRRIFVLASIVAIAMFAFGTVGQPSLAEFSTEIRRYSGVNPWYFGLALLAIFWSYLAGWIYAKVAQVSKGY